jgi:hypothetical protein
VIPVTPAPTTTTSTFMFFCSFGNLRIGVLSIQKGMFLIPHCSVRMCTLAVRKGPFCSVTRSAQPDFHPPVQDVVSRQYAEIKQAHDRVKHLRDAAKKG